MPTIERLPIEIVDVEKVLLSVAPKDEDGRTVADPQIVWESSDENVIALIATDNLLEAWAISGEPGTAVVTVRHGELAESIAITVRLGEPSALNLSAGTPVHE